MAEIKKNQSNMTNESLVTWRATLRLLSGNKWPRAIGLTPLVYTIKTQLKCIYVCIYLPLASQIARMVTAYQLDTRLELDSPVALSLYFDNLYTTPDPTVMLSVFDPFTLTQEHPNTFQDAGYRGGVG